MNNKKSAPPSLLLKVVVGGFYHYSGFSSSVLLYVKSFRTTIVIVILDHTISPILTIDNAFQIHLKLLVMPTTVITTDDLREFKMELLEDLKEILNNKSTRNKQWLKSTEVMEMLKISPGTLQNLRVNGTLPYTRIGGLIYYDSSEIEQVLENSKVNLKQQ